MTAAAELVELPRAVPRVAGMLYGGDYNPEQWPEETWLEDVELMREAGVNLVSRRDLLLGRCSSRRRRSSTSPGSTASIDLLWSKGSRSTSRRRPRRRRPGSPGRYPEVLPVTADGVRLELGSRTPRVPELANPARGLRADRRAARASLRVPIRPSRCGTSRTSTAVTCLPATAKSRPRTSGVGSRRGTAQLAELNRVWGTAFWGQRYGSFDQIAPPRRTPASVNPTQALDWRRFCSDAFLECFEAERDVLAAATPVRAGARPTSCAVSSRSTTGSGRGARTSSRSTPTPTRPTPRRTSRPRSTTTSRARSPPALAPARTRHGRRQLAAGERAQTARSDEALGETGGCARLGRRDVLSVARGARRRREVPQWHGPARGPALPRLARDPGARRRPPRARRGRRGRRSRLTSQSSSTGTTGGRSTEWITRRSCSTCSGSSSTGTGRSSRRTWPSTSRTRLSLPRRLPPRRGAGPASRRPTRWARSRTDRPGPGGALAIGFFSGVVDENDHVRCGSDADVITRLLGARVDEVWPLVAGSEQRVAFRSGTQSVAREWTEWLEPDGAETLATYDDGPLAGLPWRSSATGSAAVSSTTARRGSTQTAWPRLCGMRGRGRGAGRAGA